MEGLQLCALKACRERSDAGALIRAARLLAEVPVRAADGEPAFLTATSLLDEAAGHPVDRARQSVRDAILLGVADARAAGLLAALAVAGSGQVPAI